MFFQTLLNNNNLTIYRLSKISGIPKTTLMDIASGKSDIKYCQAITVQKLAESLNCSMEDILKIDNSKCDFKTGKPKDDSYLECNLPLDLQESIKDMVQSWEIEDRGETDLHWDIYWCTLNADINSAEVNQIITSEQATYLRKKYLRMEEEI